MARREAAAATLQYLTAMAMSDGAMAATPAMSFGLSGSFGSAATRSHSTRSADCVCAASGASTAKRANATTPRDVMSKFYGRRRLPASRLVAGLLAADIGDAQHVGGAGGAEGHAGHRDDALPGLGAALAEGDAAGMVDHVVDVARVLGDDAMHAPGDRELAAGGDVGRHRDDRCPR